MSKTGYHDVWKALSKVSLPWCGAGSQPGECATATTPRPSLPYDLQALDLQCPPDFCDFLYDFDLPPTVIEKSVAKITEAVEEQMTLHQESYRSIGETFLQLKIPSTSSNPMAYLQRARKVHHNSFNKQLLSIRSSALEALEQLQATHRIPQKTFNPVILNHIRHFKTADIPPIDLHPSSRAILRVQCLSICP